MPTAHAFLPASGASAWSRCAQWASMKRQFPQESGDAANEGTAAHWVGSELLERRKVIEGSLAPNGYVVTDEMIEGADLLFDVVQQRIGQQPQIEQRLAIPFIHERCFGTPDVWGYWKDTSDLYVEIIDYKFGHGFVDEYFNLQGICYLLGVLARLGFDGKIVSSANVKCSFTIVQPRCYFKGEPVRTHSFTIAEALPIINNLKTAALNAYEPNPVATTGTHCRYCPGRHVCNALQRAAYSDAEFADGRQPVEINATAAALELRMLERSLDRLTARVEGLRELTLTNIRTGKAVPYYHAEQGKGRIRWNVPVEQVIALGSLYGKNLEKPTAITPTQALKLGIDESIVKAYSFTPTGELKLVADSPSDARRVFGKEK